MKEAQLSATLRRILQDTQVEIQQDKDRESPKRVRQLLSHAPAPRSFHDALKKGHALIGEIKEKSPSQGRMVPQNVTDSVTAYRENELVKAVSVLTSRTHFGENMTVGRMRSIKEEVGKPVLRKDFVIEPYQVFQARAYGADAILLMANILTPEEMAQLSEIAFELGMDVLFETHGPEEIKELPATARIVGINCRSFKGGLAPSNFTLARLFRQWRLSSKDKSVSLDRFDYIGELPPAAIKVAESGVSAENCVEVFAKGFQAILVGTSLLMDRRGIRAALGDFESRLLAKSKAQQPGTHLETQTA